MKAKDLMELLESVDPDEEVYFLSHHSSYPEDFWDEIKRHMKISHFFGSDFDGTLLLSGGQVGGI